MSPRRPTVALLVVASLLLITNSLWLFPHEGETRYTYERSEVTVENGTLAYHGRGATGFGTNNLNPVGCQPGDGQGGRVCAFDRHLVDHPPVTVPREQLGSARPEFVRIDGAYYRRIHRANFSSDPPTVTHDVERVEPRTVLAESALNLSGSTESPPDDSPLELRVAVSGDTTTSYELLGPDELGDVYRLNGSYYTVVRTDEVLVDHGLDPLRYESSRLPLAVVGLLLLLWSLSREFDD